MKSFSWNKSIVVVLSLGVILISIFSFIIPQYNEYLMMRKLELEAQRKFNENFSKNFYTDENGSTRFINRLTIELTPEGTQADLEKLIEPFGGKIVRGYPIYQVMISAQSKEEQKEIVDKILNLNDPKIGKVYPTYLPPPAELILY